MNDAPTPTKGYRANHRKLTDNHSDSVPDRNLGSMSDVELATRMEMKLVAKPIPSDAAHTSSPAQPIPFPPAKPFFPSHPFKI